MFFKSLADRFTNLIAALQRYPVIAILVLAATVLNFYMIESGSDEYVNVLLALLIGILLSLVAQQIYEQFFTTGNERLFLQIGALLLTLGYYFAIRSIDLVTMEVEVKTAVAIFALTMVFIWIPSMKSKVLFTQTFMATFKAVVTTALFTIVLAIGLNLSIFAVDQLLFSVHYKVYSHVLNLIFVLFSPLFFLSLIPLYPGKDRRLSAEQQAHVEEATATPKVLKVLLSYVVVPLAWLYTLILVIYILLNISGDFWTDNLLEPMLVSYSITIIVITILVSNLENAFALSFRKVLPKLLLPIVLFQLVASLLKIGDMGITHGRYYVLLFGVFALLTSIIFSFFSIQRSGWIAAILIVFSAVSIIPPIDAFTVSRNNQTKLLQETLIANEMWKEGEVVANPNVSAHDKIKITQTYYYLDRLQYTDKIDWLPNSLHFSETFGFQEMYEENDQTQSLGQSAYLNWEGHPSFDVTGYQQLLHFYIDYDEDENEEMLNLPVEIQGKTYRVEEFVEEGELYLQLMNQDQSLLRFNVLEAFQEVLEKGERLTMEKATIIKENEHVRMKLIVNFVDHYETRYNSEVYMLIEIK